MGNTLQSPLPVDAAQVPNPGGQCILAKVDQGFTRPAPAARAAASHEMFTLHRPSHPPNMLSLQELLVQSHR